MLTATAIQTEPPQLCLTLAMSLNTRTGLYTMPSHHLHGANPTTRPTFNSMDFAAAEAESPRTKSGPVQSVKEGKSANHTPQEKKAKKKKKRNSVSTHEDRQTSGLTPATSTPLIKVTPATGSSKGKSKAKNSDGKSDAQSGKKRKRESQGDVELPKMTQRLPGSGGFIVGADMLQNVQTCVKAACDVFRGHAATTAPVEQPSKKKTKAARKSNDTVDFDRMAEETQIIDKEAKKKRMKERRRSANAGMGRPATANPASVLSAPIVSSPVRKTPVPLPVKAPSNAANALTAERIGRRDSRFLVLDTPPSQLSKTPGRLPDSPIPFKLPDATKPSGWEKAEKAIELSPPTPVVGEAPSSAPPALNKHRLEEKRDGRVSLTASNLMRYTQPLNDKSKSRPQSRAASAAASTAGSTTSGGTTPSIKDLLAHVGKPYSRSGAEIDPFVVPEIKKKTFRECHDEASAKEFTERYRAVQKAVNFTDEREYLDQAVAWRTANDALGPLPCLGIKASGCNSKREKVLRLSKDDASSPAKPLVITQAEHAALLDAKQRAAEAERFLARAVAARVPVPLGRLEGVWKLFCPAYSELHVDKYARGQRTLTMFSLAGFKPHQDQVFYTARLSIPPRSMLFSIRSFSAPPHASFRATRVRTAAEGYALELVFLGNGYLLLRLDLGLLLSGKPALMRGGRRVLMEFVGVHESAVVWRAEQDELEVVGRRLFAKYDGEG